MQLLRIVAAKLQRLDALPVAQPTASKHRGMKAFLTRDIMLLREVRNAVT